MIEIRNLRKEYNGEIALNNLNIKINRGEIYGFIGSDGAGKTTLLRILSGILKQSSGEIIIESENLSYVPQKFGLYEELTVFENMDFFAEIYAIESKEKNKKIEEILNFLELLEFKKKAAGKLSGGMKQKLSLGCALISNPEILIMDEPTVGLDPVARGDIWGVLKKLSKEKKCIVVSTSYFEEGEKCDRVCFLHQGNVLEEGAPENLRKKFPFTSIDILSEKPKEIFEFLKNLDFVIDSVLYGNRIHLIIKENFEIDNLAQILKKEGFPVKDVLTSKVTMEDLFVYKLKENGKQYFN